MVLGIVLLELVVDPTWATPWESLEAQKIKGKCFSMIHFNPKHNREVSLLPFSSRDFQGSDGHQGSQNSLDSVSLLENADF